MKERWKMRCTPNVKHSHECVISTNPLIPIGSYFALSSLTLLFSIVLPSQKVPILFPIMFSSTAGNKSNVEKAIFFMENGYFQNIAPKFPPNVQLQRNVGSQKGDNSFTY